MLWNLSAAFMVVRVFFMNLSTAVAESVSRYLQKLMHIILIITQIVISKINIVKG